MKYKIFTTIILILTMYSSFSQVITFEKNHFSAEKWDDAQLVIPIEIVVENNTAATISSKNLVLTLDNARAAMPDQLTAADFANIQIRNNNQPVTLGAGKKTTRTFYLVLDKNIKITANKTFYVDASLRGLATSSAQIYLIRPNDIPYTLSDYTDSRGLTLDAIIKVESKNNVLTIYGTKNEEFQQRNIALRPGEVLAVWEKKNLIGFRYWNFLDAFSIFSIPYKIRPQLNTTIKSKDTTFSRSALSELNNIGLNLELGKIQIDRYFSTGKKSTHKLSLGIFAAPTIEELDSLYTKGYLKKDVKSKQLFVSAGITISYSYNDISFVFVPFGWDMRTSAIGREWIYNGKRWWGFGIGINPKIFSTILNN